MSHRTPDHLIARPSRRTWRRRILLPLGTLAVLGGLAWSASASSALWSDDEPDRVATESAAVPPGDADRVQETTQAVGSWLELAGGLASADGTKDDLVFGSKEFFAAKYPQLFQSVDFAAQRVQALAADPTTTLASLDARLDDIDGDGDPASDFHDVPGLVVDLDADVAPAGPGGRYDVTVRLDAELAADSPLALRLDGLRINDQGSDVLTLELASTLRIDPAATGPKKITIPVTAAGLGSLRVGVKGTYTGDDALAFNAGILGVRATGTVTADAGAAVRLKDPNGDGALDLTELGSPAALLSPTCVSDGAKVDLTVTTDLAGLSGKVGTIKLDDADLCNGLGAPDVELGDLAQFRNITLGDFVNGLAQVTQALQTAQDAGDLDVPFIKEPLRDFVQANERLVAFFVDNGFTDADDPMSTITVNTAQDAPLQTIQAVLPKLATALGIDLEDLGLRFDSGRVVFDLKASSPESDTLESATLDFGDKLAGLGVTDVTGTGTATIDPSYDLDLGVGIDLAPRLALADRFYLTNGASGSALTLDAPVTADLHVQAIASVLRLKLDDADPAAAVPLLRRKDATKPMVSVALTDPDKNGRVTLAELSAAAALPVKATVNAEVPTTRLDATADAVGFPMAAGHVTLAWPTVADPATLKVEADGEFTDVALPFAFDTSNPRALISKVLEVTQKAVSDLRARIADGDVTTTKPLPLVGKSVADLDPLLVKIQGTLDKLIQTNELLTLDQLKTELTTVIKDALGIKSAKGASAAALKDFVEFKFEKKSGTKPASVVVDLHVGACTSDRKEGRDGCSVTPDPVKVPFNLDLGTGSKVGGVAGLGTAGEVQVSYDARADLTLGVQLPDVQAPKKLGELPKVTGSPKLFVQDDAVVDLGVGARIDGTLKAGLGPLQVSLGHGDDTAKAAVAARFRLAATAPTGARLVIGTPEFNAFLSGLLPKPGTATVHETDDALEASCEGVTGPVDACAVLPVYFEDTDLGTVRFAAADLLTPSGWTVDSTEVEAKLQNEAIQFALLVDGVRTLTTQIQEGLRSLPTGTKIPLIGADVTAGADVLQQFDEAVLAKVDALSDAVASSGNAGAVQARTEEILADVPGLPEGQSPKVTLTCRPAAGGAPVACASTDTIDRIQSFQVDLHLEYAAEDGTGTFDIGFPGLRLASQGEFTAKAGIKLNVGFGVDRDLGFYIPTEGKEVEVSAEANLPHSESGADLTGDLAFFPIEIEDNQDAKPDVKVGAALDLTTTRPDKRLPLADLGRAQLTPSVSAETLLKLGVKTVRSEGPAGMLPTFSTNFVLDAGITWNGTGSPQTRASIDFNNVRVDAGSLVSDIIKPTVKTLRKYTGPLEKPIEAIQKPIPGVAEAAKLTGRPAPTWYDAFKAADRAANGPDSKSLQLIDRVIMLVNLVKAVDQGSTSAGQIEIGSFSVLADAARQPVPLNEADQLVTGESVTTPDLITKLGFDTPKGEFSAARTKGGLSFPAFEDPKSLFGMLLGKDVPLVYYDAGQLGIQRGFQFSYPIGPARLYIGGSAGVYGHLAAGFDTYGMRKALEVLTDDDPDNNGAWDVTKGLLQGLYLDDFDQSGNDVPEIRFEAKLVAGASVGIPGLQAGAEGGVRGVAEFNLKADQTGRLRYPQIAAQLKVNANPLCFFDATARVDAFIRAYVDTPFGKADYPIASTVIYDQPNLFSFCDTPQEDRKNRLAELDDGKLTLKADTSPQSYVMTQVDAETVELTGEMDGEHVVEQYSPVTKVGGDLLGGDDVFDVQPVPQGVPALPVTVCGGPGNDRIMVAAGTATLYGDAGPGCNPVPTNVAGDDTLISGADADTLTGGPGNDSLDGGPGADRLDGEADNDVLRGGSGDDEVIGGAGDDTSDYGDHGSAVTINLPGPSGSAGEADTASSVENVRGGSGADTINLPATGSLVVDGGTGDDTVNGSNSTGILMGNDGDDTFVGGTGNVQVVGSGGDDTLVDGPGAQTFLGMEGRDTVDYSAAAGPLRVVLDGEPGDGPEGQRRDNIIDADLVIGGEHPDQLTGSSADEELRGGAGADVLEGGAGADTLIGGDGDDTLAGNAGSDRLEGGAGKEILRGGGANDTLLGASGDDDLDGEQGDDSLDGGPDDDRLRGGEGGDDLRGGGDVDRVDYSDRTDDLRVSFDDAAFDGAGFGSEHDNVHDDIEKYLGSSGQDDVRGSGRDQVFVTNDGRDDVAGLGGADQFDGGNGNDRFFDLEFNSWTSPNADGSLVDHFVGGEGNDEAYGNGGADLFEMGAGNDTARGGQDNDTFRLGDGNDDVYAGAGDDDVEGEAGDDSLRGEDGKDKLRGGPSVKGDSIRGGNGADEIWNGEGGGTVTTGIGGNSSEETDFAPNVVHGTGGSDNRYNGSNGPDTFLLGAGNDRVGAGLGDDVIELGEGTNQGDGGAGDDTIVAGSGDDNVFGLEGDDVLEGGGGKDQVDGGAGDDVLRGGDGNDVISGGAGKDLLDGGGNADTFDGGADLDTLTYASRTTDLVVSDDGNANDGGVEDKSTVSPFVQRDWVNDSIEVFVGGSGDDHLWLADKDRTVAGLRGGDGNDRLEIRSTTSPATTFVGGAGDDVMTGSGGADTFDQGAAPDGADDMSGGGGADRADYSGRPEGSAKVTFDGTADDGAPGEGDNVRGDIESAPGADSEALPTTVAVSPVSVTEGAAGATRTARFTVRLDAVSTSPTPVSWKVAGGTATAGTDYTGTAGVLTVPAGTLTGTFDVTVRGDATDEPNETAQVSVTGPANSVQTTLTIVDDDSPVVRPTISVSSVSEKEGNAGLRTLTFKVALSKATTVPVRVRVATANGTAAAGKDYVAAARWLTFAPGKTSLTFQVKVKGDRVRERSERFRVLLSGATGGVSGRTGVGTIVNDDR
ncbi:Calx-beta domain-containing protein [Nocardioides sp. URHA0020]|uniref:Calx-beta domain-containing protein n=1 Tax=Nocardioides sp. URHA0020 TaxID=1380392 RepID=UPI00048A7755|nr:Calx-beta domain-containing protein [Nocardioides sp. URHA0020]